ncbi:MAG: hypothetical protein WDW38_011442 [Sanguina aurantia]
MTLLSLTVNTEPSRDLNYSSWGLDEAAWKAKPHLISPSIQHAIPVNGNMRLLFPGIEEEEVRRQLPAYLLVSTNTRTVFSDHLSSSTKLSIASKVASPNFGASSPQRRGHPGMDTLTSVDPRISNHKPAYEASIGPGHYEPDPLGHRTVGTLNMEDGETHHTGNVARDAGRPSASFVSPQRGQTFSDVAQEAVSTGVSGIMHGPEFSVWTGKGFFSPRKARAIDSERWGENNREPRARQQDLCRRLAMVRTNTVT